MRFYFFYILCNSYGHDISSSFIRGRAVNSISVAVI